LPADLELLALEGGRTFFWLVVEQIDDGMYRDLLKEWLSSAHGERSHRAECNRGEVMRGEIFRRIVEMILQIARSDVASCTREVVCCANRWEATQKTRALRHAALTWLRHRIRQRHFSDLDHARGKVMGKTPAAKQNRKHATHFKTMVLSP
jgi:hypothetical protein